MSIETRRLMPGAVEADKISTLHPIQIRDIKKEFAKIIFVTLKIRYSKYFNMDIATLNNKS